MNHIDAAPLDWSQNQSDVRRIIAQKRAPLKIVLKTKDDPFFLQEWIDHHVQIVGRSNIIIFDNESTNPQVGKIYDENADLLVVRYSGFHNNIHNVDIFNCLYEALRQSAGWFCFLDTDERLIKFDGQSYFADDSLVSFLESNSDTDIVPAVWLHNVTGSRSLYMCGESTRRLMHELAWGKPILRSSSSFEGFINHNVQVNKEVWDSRIARGLFVLHLADLHPEQRIASNLNKLRARGFASLDDSAESVLSREIDADMDPKINDYVREIRRAVAALASGGYASPSPRAGTIELKPGGKVEYFSDRERLVMQSFLDCPDEVLRKALSLPERT